MSKKRTRTRKPKHKGPKLSSQRMWLQARKFDPELKHNRKQFEAAYSAYKGRVHNFWLAQGVNFMSSNYEEGLWTPMLDIYSKGSVLPPRDKIMDRLANRYWTEEHGWVGLGRVLSVWLVQTPEVQCILFLSALRHLGEDLPGCDPRVEVIKPFQPTVWKLFSLVKAQILGGLPGAGQEEDDDNLDRNPERGSTESSTGVQREGVVEGPGETPPAME